jgi:ubiquinone/menaquinone biosynthesis C-methylase UbiE
MPERYQFGYRDDTVYASVVGLLERFHLAEGQVIVDIGCGFGAIAEAVRERGLTYVGFDVDADGLKDLAERGFETERLDLSVVPDAIALISKRLDGRQLAAVVMIDSLEHITNGPDVLAGLHRVAQLGGGAPLILAVPNVTHIDLAAKLLLGRWDMTTVGLLDDTHVSLFSADRLRQMTTQAGWTEIGSDDFVLPVSDQHFPADATALTKGTPLHDLLRLVREQASNGAIVNEFVRAYACLSVPSQKDATSSSAPGPFLSVLMRTQGTRPATLQEALLSLAAQTSQNFEVLLLPHDVPREELTHLHYLVDAFGEEFSRRVRIIPVDGGGRSSPLLVGTEAARGRYIAILDDDDVAFGHWLETFETLAAKHPGRVLRSRAAEQYVRPTLWSGARPGYEITSRPRNPFPDTFDLLAHLYSNQSPPCALAFPRSIFSDHGLRFDDSLPVLEDWDVLMQAGLWCGVADSGKVTGLWRRWAEGDSSTSVHSDNEWKRARSAVLAKLDARPLLLPPRSITALHSLQEEIIALTGQRDQIRHEFAMQQSHVVHLTATAEVARLTLADIRASISWKLGSPLRAGGRLARRVLHRRSSTDSARQT